MADEAQANFKIKKLKVAAERLDIGTSSSCSVRINDPIAAPRHCRILYRPDHPEGEFLLQDLGTSTGTYLDGVAVPTGEGPCLRGGPRSRDSWGRPPDAG